MGLRDWWQSRKSAQRFRQAMARGDFAEALEMAGDEGVSPEEVAEARRASELANALLGESETADLRTLVEDLYERATEGRVELPRQLPVSLGVLAERLAHDDHQSALRLVERTQHAEGKAVALRKVAAHLVGDATRLDEALDVVFKLDKPIYVLEELRNLTFSRLFQSDFERADVVLSRMRVPEWREPILELMAFVRRYETWTEAERPALKVPSIDDRAQFRAAVAARQCDALQVREDLGYVNANIRDSVRLTFTGSLGYAGRFEHGMTVVRSMDDPDMRDLGLIQLTVQFPVPWTLRKQWLEAAAQSSQSPAVMGAWTQAVCDCLFGERIEEAQTMLTSIGAPEFRRGVVASVVDVL